MSILTVEQVTHMYGDKKIFQDISFRLLPGEHAGLVGSNGAGKSTLLRILTGELLPDAGTMEWHPHVNIGFLQQHIDLKPGTTIMQYLRSAFAHLYEIEQSMLQIAEKMAEADDELERWLAQYGELQNKLEHSDFYQIDAKIEEIAAGLGILELGKDRDVEKLSGGQRTKLLLGKLLLEEPHVLLLDEPTNFLDDSHIDWLIGYLKSYEHAYLVVSHDERFLNEITTVIYHLEHLTLKRYTGNYEAFLSSYEQSKQQIQAGYERQQREIDRLESFIQKNRNRKAKQAKSREKVLEKINRIDRPTSGPQPRFMFQVNTDPVNRIIEAKNIQIGYSEPLFGPIDLLIKRGEKIAIVGYNGIGKSTMLKTLLGHLQPISGTVQLGERVQAAYFAQEDFASTLTALEQLWSYRPDLTQKEIRQTLAMSGLTDKHIRQPLSSLSGGEQSKVRLCELMLTASNVLVLDEPTNHLDVRAKDALKEALKKYKGTILLVSHEPDFYEDWVTQIWQVQGWCNN
ncbi:ATP-binding cassette domain-containing protein [Paenibacillus profundus]|uniref:ATP-binding cassette domain-containing protein n=1 Tax=Paenibacillus profundus TaxID=1173085 RepID=A0ABS8YPM4_9BACL|nr:MULTISPECIES: ABC-F family ATP-binding cassette domain-containing protein [Paenibacillus]MCE5171564.1 ATP-binding cassette domain-containing protein [Paenibacillus profundus]